MLCSELFEQIINTGCIYNIVITGTVGSGKTIRFNILSDYLGNINKVNIYPEWISRSKIAVPLLKEKLEKHISAFTLQSFILDDWERYLYEKPLNRINLFERTIEDSNLCFCDGFSEDKMKVLYDKENIIKQRYPIPTYDNCHFTLLLSYENNSRNAVMSNISDILETIAKDYEYIKQHPDLKCFNRIFGLKIPVETAIERIKLRNRDGENNYTKEEITYFTNKYNELFTKLSNKP